MRGSNLSLDLSWPWRSIISARPRGSFHAEDIERLASNENQTVI